MRFLLSILSWLFVAGLTSCQQEQPKVTPEYRKLTSAVYASGSIEPLDAYQVFAPAAGILEEKLVVEGNVVEPGEPLFVIRQETTSLQLTGARERLTTAERNASPNSALLQQARLQLEQARERYLQDSTDYQRQQNLLAKNATPRRSVEQARLAYISSKSALQSAKVNLEQLHDNLNDQLREAQIQYQIAAEERGNTIVKSRMQGKVYQTSIEEGEMVSPNQALAVIGHADAFYLELIVDERDIAKVAPGMRVLFTSDILSDTLLEAEVSKIYPYMNQEDRSFRVDASIPQDDLLLYDGASVEANIIIEQKERALVIPRSALIGEDSVLIEREGEAVMVKITKGIENLEMVEVLSGLQEDSKLLTQR
jgi:multidrug efflux pump subunit AcrA (membrane-fusion protein)